jgi:hypothetical protein
LAPASVREKPETAFVVQRSRDATKNLRTHFKRIIKRAGVVPWEKPCQNLRSSRETELAGTFPLHVVCAWIGNSEAVARQHYLQVTDEHFAAALDPERCKALQKALQNLPDFAERSGTCALRYRHFHGAKRGNRAGFPRKEVSRNTPHF